MCECNPKISIVKTSADGKTNIETCKCGATKELPATFEGVQDKFMNKANPTVIGRKKKDRTYYDRHYRSPKVERLNTQVLGI